MSGFELFGSIFPAASATFALKAGEWFRRGRLFMVSPVRGDYPSAYGRVLVGDQIFWKDLPRLFLATPQPTEFGFSRCQQLTHTEIAIEPRDSCGRGSRKGAD
jgi:hypothetical protein